MKYSQYDVDKVRSESDIRMIIPGAIESRTTQDITCPFCGAEKNSVSAARKAITTLAASSVATDSPARWKHMPTITAST